MKKTVFLSALYLAFIAWTLLTMFFGKTGVTSLQRLAADRARLAANLDSLDSVYGDLTRRLEDLRTDPESIIVEARSLGLYRPGDHAMHLGGSGSPKSLPDPGRVLRAAAPAGPDEGIFRFLSLLAGGTVLLAAWISGKGRRDRPAR